MAVSKKKSRLERYAYKTIVKSSGHRRENRHHILSEQENALLKAIKHRIIVKASIAGILGVVLLYVPFHFWPQLFPNYNVWVPVVDITLQLPLGFYAYGVILVIIEIAYLTLLNIRTVREVSAACGYPHPQHDDYATRIDDLVAIGLSKNHKKQIDLGINPYIGLSKVRILLITLLGRMRAAITNMVFRFLVQRLMGRYAFRLFIDLAGMVVYAFWNSWASIKVMNETKVRVMATSVIEDFSEQLAVEQQNNEEFRAELYNMLYYIAVAKRSFHYNHYLLSLAMLQMFEVPINPNHAYDKTFLQRVRTGSSQTQLGFSKLLMLGMLIDGDLSEKERFLVLKMHKEGYFMYTLSQARQFTKDYRAGRGVGELIYGEAS